MATSALIVLDDESAHFRVFGLDWLDYTVRRLALAGIGHVVVLVEQVPRALRDTLDRARRTGMNCTVAQSTAELLDLFHPHDAVLLIGATRLVDPRLLRDLSEADGEYLLCTRDGSGRSLERVDPESWWTGLAVVSGARVRAMSSAPGDWNAGSLLMRSAVQAGVERKSVDGSTIVEPADAAGVAAFEISSTLDQLHPCEGWGSRFVVEPIARMLLRIVAPRLASAATIASPSALALSLIAILVTFAPFDRRAAVAVACIVLAKIGCTVAWYAVRAMGMSTRLAATIQHIVDWAGGGVLVALAMPPEKGGVQLVLALIVVAFGWLCRRGIEAMHSPPHWWPDGGGHALLIAAATVTSPSLLAPTLALVAVHCFVGLAWLQDKVSELLTSRR